jgi:hypothetical protein
MDTLLVQQEPFITTLSQQGNIMNNSKLISISLVLASFFVYFFMLLLIIAIGSIIAEGHINTYTVLAVSLIGSCVICIRLLLLPYQFSQKNG